MPSAVRVLFTPLAKSLLLFALLGGCSAKEDPPYYSSSGGSAGESPIGGRGSGGRNGSGGAEASGGSGESGGRDQTGGTGDTSAGGSHQAVGGNDAGGTGTGGNASGGATGGGATTCDGECRFVWPLLGDVSRDWTISNYVDLDPGPAILDFRGGDRSYNGHLGIDIAIASFRKMDQGVSAFAVAPGVVTATHDGEFDRNTIATTDGCNAVANSISITHDDGREARYLHFRKDSILVDVGQEVAAGQKLGEIGSSGCSSSPHLHLELFDNGQLLDPFEEGLWLHPPDYDAPPQVMEVILSTQQFTSVDDVQNAPPSPATLPAGSAFGISVITGGTRAGTVEQVTFYRDDAYGFALSPFTFDGTERHYMRWWSASAVEGPWRAEISLDDEVATTLEFLAE